MSDDRTPGQGPPQHPTFQVRIPLEWQEKEDVPIVYANQVLISHAGPEFFLVFGTVIPPVNTAEIPDTLKIQPQVRIVVSHEAMGAIVKAMNDNLRRFRDGKAKQSPPG